MKRILMILLLFLILGNSSFSQTTYPKIVQDSLVVITTTQLKQTNSIFLEHQKLLLQIPELENKIGLLSKSNETLQQSIVVKDQQISNLQNINILNQSVIEETNEELKKYKCRSKLLIIGGCTVSASLIFFANIKMI